MLHDISFDLKGFAAAERVQQQFRRNMELISSNMYGDALFSQKPSEKHHSTKECVSIYV